MRSKLNITAIVFLLFVGCESARDVKEDINVLRVERGTLQSEVSSLEARAGVIQSKLEETRALKFAADSELVLAAGMRNGTAKYLLTFKLKQEHMTLDISQHIKDEANAFEIELPVDPEMYNQVTVGTVIADNFRAGSAIMHGSFGSMVVTVVGKRMVAK